jgi:hypothetical protein
MKDLFNTVFYWCVKILENYSGKLGMTYEELNVWLFVIIYPILFIILLTYRLYFHVKYNRLKKLKSNLNK